MQYSIWKPAAGEFGYNGNDRWVVTWNGFGDDGYHNVVVIGANPNGNISLF